MDRGLARRGALRVVYLQAAAAALVAIVGGLFFGVRVAWSAAAGGLIGVLASLAMVFSIFRHGPDANPKRVLRGIYRGEFYKFGVTVVLLALALVALNVSAPALLAGYIGTFVAYWLALVTPGTAN